MSILTLKRRIISSVCTYKVFLNTFKSLHLSFVFIFTLAIPGKCQSYGKQKLEFAAINIGINSLLGGAGAVINKKKGQRSGKVFFKGLAQGALGGSTIFLSKELAYTINVNQRIEYAWIVRLTNSIGSSITQNAMSNIDFWERWHLNLGIIRIDYWLSHSKIKVRLLPSALVANSMLLSQGKFNLKKSIRSGIMVYEKDGLWDFGGSKSGGIGLATAIGIDKNITGKEFYSLFAHETIHMLQYDNFVWFNPLLNGFDQKLKTEYKLYQKASNYIYFDLNGITLYGFYISQINKPWECRYTEREAEHFSQRIILSTCK